MPLRHQAMPVWHHAGRSYRLRSTTVGNLTNSTNWLRPTGHWLHQADALAPSRSSSNNSMLHAGFPYVDATFAFIPFEFFSLGNT